MRNKKTCRKCRKDFSASDNQIKKSDYICTSCRLIYDAAWREKRRGAGLPSSGSKTWDESKRAKFWKEYYADPAVKKRRAAQMKQYRDDPEKRLKHLARWAVNRALISGRLIKTDCTYCGVDKMATRIHGHHPDYEKPLEVVWLCGPCHRKKHAKAEGR